MSCKRVSRISRVISQCQSVVIALRSDGESVVFRQSSFVVERMEVNAETTAFGGCEMMKNIKTKP